MGGGTQRERERMLGTDLEHEMLCFNFYFKHVRVANPKFE